MAVADPGENDRTHQLPHRPHREIGNPHQELVARFEPRDPHPHLARAAAWVGVQVDRQSGLRGCRPDRLPYLVQHRLGGVHPVEDDPGGQAELGHPHQLRDGFLGGLAG